MRCRKRTLTGLHLWICDAATGNRRFEAEGAFTSLYFMNVKMTEKELREAAEKILSDSECGRVFRMKGFMRVDSDSEDGSGLSAWAECDRRQWIELNATKNEITIRPLHVGQEVLIVIGEELHEEKIKILSENLRFERRSRSGLRMSALLYKRTT